MSNRKKSERIDNVSRRDFIKGAVPGLEGLSRVSQNPPEKRILGIDRPVSRRTFVKVAAVAAAATGIVLAVPMKLKLSSNTSAALNYRGKVKNADRQLAALQAKAAGVKALAALNPGGVPDYFGSIPNYANSPLPAYTITTPASTASFAGVAVQSGGSGYTTPVVTISGGGGTGATGTARVSNGVIIGVVVTNLGTGYTTAPTIAFNDPSPRAKGAVATAVMTTTAGTPSITVTTGTGIRKFVNGLPGLGPTNANNLGQYLPIAVADTATFPGSDYYQISLQQYTEQMHSDLPPTTLRGYVQVSNGTPVAPIHYMGPVIVANRNRPVRIRFTNNLPTGAGGNLFIPVDTTYMGAGLAPDGTTYTQNRSTLHLHGGNTVWISDGTPHQWTVPAGESTNYPKGMSAQDVPDMPASGPGALTFFFSNQQSSRLMFYHDHAYGITRLNVYAGMAAGYLLTDQYEQDLINGTNLGGANPTSQKLLPDLGIPLIIQDKTFVDATTIAAQDPTWNWGTTPPTPKTGDLWWPHVYMPNQNPYSTTGINPMGRWDYGPWFFPPWTVQFGTVTNPYYNPTTAPWEPPVIPGTPNPSGTPESFMDTPIVNGTLYPTLTVQPQVYRFRILNACNDRMVNLQLYVAAGIIGAININGSGSGYTQAPSVTITGGGGTGATAIATITNGAVTAITLVTTGSGYTTAPTVTLSAPTAGVTATATAVIYTAPTEVGMLPAVLGSWPADYPTPDSRPGGFPDPATRGPAIVQIGTEGGFLPAPVVITNRPVGYDYNRRSITVLNVLEKALFLGPAERADILVDFTNFAGKTLILYSDAPAPNPGFDTRFDYFTGDGDQTSSGGAPNTIPGYGPNTRTIMQITVAAGASSTAPPNDYNTATFAALTTALTAAFAASQPTIIVPQAVYDAVYNASFPTTATAQYVAIQDTTHTFTPIGQTLALTMPLFPKGIQELFTNDYGRMNALLSYEVPNTNGTNQTTIIQAYIDPPNEIMEDTPPGALIGALNDGTQIWKFTHNGVDTHAMHFHLFNLQLVNRVGWDGVIKPPDANELGWKETIRMNPLEDAIVALRPMRPTNHTYKVPNSVRPLDTTRPIGSTIGFTNVNPSGTPITVTNHLVNFGWEYVDHCHLLGHEENDMMRPMCFVVPPEAPTNLTTTVVAGGIRLNWVNNAINTTGITIQRATDSGFTQNLTLFNVAANAVTYNDTSAAQNTTYYYQVIAQNTVGDPQSTGYPTMTGSTPSNTATGRR